MNGSGHLPFYSVPTPQLAAPHYQPYSYPNLSRFQSTFQSQPAVQYQAPLQDYAPYPMERLDPVEGPRPLQSPSQHAVEDNAETSEDDDDDDADSDDEDDEDMPIDESARPVRDQQPAEGIGSADATSKNEGRPRPSAPRAPRRKRRKKGEGTRGGWSKGLKLGPRRAADPGAEFTNLHKQANDAFIDEQDSEKALDLILQAIAINPEIYAAHALLSEIYFDRGDDERAIAALFSGAHTSPTDPEVWQRVASACLQRSKGDRQTFLQQASYCYARIIYNNHQDIEARFQRAAVSRELGNYTKAMKDLEVILELLPRNSSVLRQIAEVCLETRNLERAKSLYEENLNYYRTHGLEGEESFTWADILVYIQLLAQQEPHDMALSDSILTLRQLSRWLLGRQEESYWDQFSEDDREWDSEDDPRRLLVPEYVPGKYPLDAYGAGLPLELRVRLGILRLKQGHETLEEALAHFEWLEADARDDNTNVYEYPDLFLDVAQALHEAKEHYQSLRYYEALKSIQAFSDTNFWLGMAANYYLCGDKVQATECYEQARAGDDSCVEARTQLSKLYADLGDKENATQNAREAVRITGNSVRKTDRRKYERKEQRLTREEAERALEQAYKLPGPAIPGAPIRRVEGYLGRKRKPRARRHTVDVDMGFNISPEKSTRRPEKAATKRRYRQLPDLKQMTQEEGEAHQTGYINRLYDHLVKSTEDMRSGDEIAQNTWMDCADSLITDFRSNRIFYPYERSLAFTGYDRQARNLNFRAEWEKTHGPDEAAGNVDQDFPMPSIESLAPTEYRDISFSDWLDVFLEYALLLANDPEVIDAQHRCYTIIKAALDCVVWHHDPEATLQIYVTYFTCALALRDAATLFNVVVRWFLRRFQFSTDAYRLFAAMNLIFPAVSDRSVKDSQLGNVGLRNVPSQRFMMRQIMNIDSNLPQDYHPAEFGSVPDFMRRDEEQGRREDGEDEQFPPADGELLSPKEMDVVLLTLYGHMLYAGGSFANALSYLFRAQSIEPQNPMVLLSIALSYLHEMLKRQNENRHMYVLQGWSFFEEYAGARRGWAKVKSDPGLESVVEREIELNRARCWHMLGTSDLAIRAYEKTLSLAAVHQDPGKPLSADYTMEAAYAIQTMYATSGNAHMAREVTERYLVV